MKQSGTLFDIKGDTLQFSMDERRTSSGKPYLALDSEKFYIALFPVSLPPLPGARSQIKYNARVTFKSFGISFHMAVRELLSDGSLISGRKSALNDKHAVIADWNGKTRTAYERLSIPERDYQMIMQMISTAVA